MKSVKRAAWAAVFSLAVLWFCTPLRAQYGFGCAGAEYNDSMKCNGCQDYVTSYAFIGSGYIAYYTNVITCCGQEYNQGVNDGACELVRPQTLAALDPQVELWHFMYLRTCSGKYQLLRLPGV